MAQIFIDIHNQGYYYFFRQGSVSHQKHFNPTIFDNLFCIERCIQYYEAVGDTATASAAKVMKRVCQAQSVIAARANGADDLIPSQYGDMGTIEALKVLYTQTNFRHFLSYFIMKFPVLSFPARAGYKIYRVMLKEK